MDVVDKVRRSAMMARVRGKNTTPELLVRRAAHALGYRYRLHRRNLPGSPDLVFPGRRKVIFVHGCYWHQHEGCRNAYRPKSNCEFWFEKFEKNKARDQRTLNELAAAGWDPLVIWECETHDIVMLNARIAKHLGPREHDDLQG
jgi:DNA mismatch endonuclease (patch repair protein)